MLRVAHVTDPHFRASAGAVLAAGPLALAGKRLAGVANLALNRRRKHRMELLEALGADLRSQTVDHLVLTGDLGNVGLAAEWTLARRWLHAYAPGARAVTVIPGNHDVYTADVVRSRSFEAALGDYQMADHRCAGEHYPFVRLRGDRLAFVAVSTCVPTGDLGAWGRIGAAQLGRLETILSDPLLEGRVRVVLLHHPPVVHRRAEEHNLRDRQDLCGVLARAGAELVLHGHDHRDEEAWLDGPAGRRIPAIGAGSASYAGGPEASARYNLYEVSSRGIVLVTRAWDPVAGRVVEVARRRLTGV